MTEIRFPHLTVNVDQDGKVSVNGPKAYVEQIDWTKIQGSADLFAGVAECPSIEMAIALGVQMDFAAWIGYKEIEAMSAPICPVCQTKATKLGKTGMAVCDCGATAREA